MSRKGLLVDYQWCTGCHSCEVACQMEYDLPLGQYGIIVSQIGPWQIDERNWQYSFIPTITKQCTLCAERMANDKLPSCVKHCQSKCLKVVDVDEAHEIMKESGKTLFMTP